MTATGIRRLLFGSSPDLLHRIVVIAGGFFLLLLVSSLLFVVLTRIVLNGKQKTLSRVFLVSWVGVAILGVVGLSMWNGYTNGGIVVSLAVGATPSLAFVTGGTLALALNIVTTDHPAWMFLWYLPPGIVLDALSFVLGAGLGAVVG